MPDQPSLREALALHRHDAAGWNNAGFTIEQVLNRTGDEADAILAVLAERGDVYAKSTLHGGVFVHPEAFEKHPGEYALVLVLPWEDAS